MYVCTVRHSDELFPFAIFIAINFGIESIDACARAHTAHCTHAKNQNAAYATNPAISMDFYYKLSIISIAKIHDLN